MGPTNIQDMLKHDYSEEIFNKLKSIEAIAFAFIETQLNKEQTFKFIEIYNQKMKGEAVNGKSEG